MLKRLLACAAVVSAARSYDDAAAATASGPTAAAARRSARRKAPSAARHRDAPPKTSQKPPAAARHKRGSAALFEGPCVPHCPGNLTDAVPPCTAAELRSCNRHPKLLITSMGGVGSTPAFELFQETNHVNDRDSHKHLGAAMWAPTRCTRGRRVFLVDPAPMAMDRHLHHRWCYDQVVVLYGDPLHAVESTVRRFGHLHLPRLRRGVGNLTSIHKIAGTKRLTPQALLDVSAATGRDESAITQYLSSWLAAVKARDAWPPLLLASTEDLYAKRCVEGFAEKHLTARARGKRELPPYRAKTATGRYTDRQVATLARATAIVEEMQRVGGCRGNA
mmetsp:Transcript_10683/g.32934  ORF Transcript_10683/g.32934 Transcript_10683/m.32934 type:complete len:334 (+) Transcript_10683:149-1150(+)